MYHQFLIKYPKKTLPFAFRVCFVYDNDESVFESFVLGVDFRTVDRGKKSLK